MGCSGDNLTSENAPKTLLKARVGRTSGIPTDFLYPWTVLTLAILVIHELLATSETLIIKVLGWAFIIFILLFGFKYVATPKTYRESVIYAKYRWAKLNGRTRYNKYTDDLEKLSEIFGISRVYNDGLIEFSDNQYGLLLKISPPKVADDDLKKYKRKIQSCLDGLPDEIYLKIIKHSALSTLNVTEHYLREVLKKKTLTREQKDHVIAMYENSVNNPRTGNVWDYYIFVSFGKRKSLKEAQNYVRAVMPGLKVGLENCGVQAFVITGDANIIFTYNQLLTRRCLI